ncbi:deacetylase, histone deacetylase/acetoin utilization protein [Schinkia azotoformans MEV2011]|uniref:Acetoin utilization protein AcuC n=1 Tax=Schinkia azotoformans MEV2011 TaxID=1348973 RepID=A0A072NL65_SCHAZ|nr:acetoin utilization protein AcuC [Schinkia azotoformans]KEF37633.1 deacetylase, histone deacetylase/acetoin utilization protein [Schinkia azotoformans MEV2011]MEC1694654.1 acetoin utilization protein AcuC [Schinkia azotoformans]MEC1715593.1 acetoin utilization protein AcuC [Schinkia azotoformans]MEC1726590.1 acetoin utilization protein AcuC [Schinkia azotoformans]MEC1741114.1 acetoin utilization protein AcuC [Schinkia azotoformans]
MSKSIYYVYSNDFQSYKFNESHPFNQRRVELTTDLLKMSGALNESHIIPPRIATDEEIGLIHDPNYIEAVRKAGYGELSEDVANNYGLGTEDVPIFPNMHEASALLVGGTLTAVDLVMEGEADHAVSLGGGLHHGFRGKASGFCIYNDSAIAIKYMQQKYGVKVLYIDTDAHHGDGVQWSFYDDPNVCTFSIHETGRYLFPGTGNVSEKGQGQGYGTSFNIPVDAFTEDESFLECFVTAIREVAEFFKPDVIISQNGVDSHVLDPLTHLSTTMKVYREIPKLAHQLAHEHCDGRWIAVGGGGYDHWRVVPRAWSLIWLEMLEKQDEIARGALPTEWIEKWQPKSPVKLIPTWEDPSNLYPPIPRKQEITEKNMQTMEKALQHIRSSRKKAN